MRRSLVVIVFLLLGVSLLAGCASQSASPDAREKVRLGFFRGEISSLFIIAFEEGYFEDEGLDVETKDYESGAQALEGLIKNEVDTATAAEFVFVTHSFGNSNLRVVTSTAAVDDFQLLAPRGRGISSPADLRGKTIGLVRTSQGEFSLGTFLALKGIPLSEITIVNMTPSEMPRALETSGVDAVVVFDPPAYELLKSYPEATDIRLQEGDPYFWLLISTNQYLAEQPVAAEKMVRALVRAQTFLEDDPGEAGEIVKEYLDLDSVYLDYAWDNSDFSIGLTQPLLLSMENEAYWCVENGLFGATQVPDYLDYVYFDALEEVDPGAVTIVH